MAANEIRIARCQVSGLIAVPEPRARCPCLDVVLPQAHQFSQPGRGYPAFITSRAGFFTNAWAEKRQ